MFETRGGTRNRTRDLPKKGSAFITSSDHWTMCWVCACVTIVTIAMAGWLHGVFVGEWLFVFPLCGFSLSLFCNYLLTAVLHLIPYCCRAYFVFSVYLKHSHMQRPSMWFRNNRTFLRSL